jgi:hypothetical protein
VEVDDGGWATRPRALQIMDDEGQLVDNEILSQNPSESRKNKPLDINSEEVFTVSLGKKWEFLLRPRR